MSISYPSDKHKRLPSIHVDEVSADEKSAVDIIPGWRPWTFSTTVLLSAIFFTAGLVVLIGLLQWQQFRNGALFAVSTTDSFSNMQKFLYRYLPNIVIVLYGMGWSWIDLDIKRLEPWYQLARREGATAAESLQLHYPLDFLPLVPFKSAKRKQWSVVSASTIMLLVAWAVTPLQNGIFNNQQLIRQSNIPVYTSNELVPLDQQNKIIGINFLNQAYSSLWLGQKLPTFTTEKNAFAPFKPTTITNLVGSNQTLKAKTKMYGVKLDCNPPAKVSLDSGSVTFDDGNGCVAEGLIPSSTAQLSKQFLSYYIGYYDDPNSDYSLQSAGCGVAADHESLIIWQRTNSNSSDPDDLSNITALFCKASYYSEPVEATISLPEQSILSFTSTGSQSVIAEDVFNITLFEYVLANGAPPGSSAVMTQDPAAARMDISETTVLHQDTQVTNMSLVVPVPNMIAFAIGATHDNPKDYLDPETFSNAMQDAYSLLFAIAVTSVMGSPDEGITSMATHQGLFEAIVLVPVFSIVSQSFLLIVAAFTCILLYLTQQRVSLLGRDPDTLASIMSLARSATFRRLFDRFDSVGEETLAKALEPYRFQLKPQALANDSTIELLEDYCGPAIDLSRESTYLTSTSRRAAKLARPFEYSTVSRISVCVCLASMIVALVFLRQKASSEHGLALPSNNTFIQQMVLNLIPTLAATLLEPFFVLISRLACLMQPLEELRSGTATAKMSLLTRYTSVPPQLAVWRAFRDRRILLSGLCFLAVLANLLTIALSGLFNVNTVAHSEATRLQPSVQAKFSTVNTTTGQAFINGLYNQNDAFYVAQTNFSTSTPLPDWTSPHYYFPPLRLPQVSASHEWRVQARGYGAELQCTELSQTQSDAMYTMEFTASGNMTRLIVTYTQKDGSKLQCRPESCLYRSDGVLRNPEDGLDGVWCKIAGNRFGRKAFEFAQQILTINQTVVTPDDPCYAHMVMGWSRTEMRHSTVQADVGRTLNVENTFITCTPKLKSALFDLILTGSGVITSMTRASADAYDVAHADLGAALDTTVANFNTMLPPAWHNDEVAIDWPNYLIKLLHGPGFLDASVNPPDAALASTVTSDVVSRLFAIQMSLNSNSLLPAAVDAAAIPAALLTSQQRVLVSENLFWIALVILILDLLVITVFYWRIPAPFLPRMPTSIASQVGFFAGSHVIDDVQKADGDLEELDKRGYRYGYGQYIGQDGWVHVGIEREPYVVSLGAERTRKRRWWSWNPT